MGELRKKFEELPEIKELLDDKEKIFFFNDDFGVYGAEHLDDFDAGFINGAWMCFQEQQKKIDAIKSKLSDIYDASDEDETVAHLLDEIQELLK